MALVHPSVSSRGGELPLAGAKVALAGGDVLRKA
jgi:hypothetical protein